MVSGWQHASNSLDKWDKRELDPSGGGEENLRVFRGLCGRKESVTICVTQRLNTPQTLTDKTGQIIWSAQYDEFGSAQIVSTGGTSSTSSVVCNLRFPGQYFDTETGLHYNFHRYYEPALGRYITEDLIRDGLNWYAYAGSNPGNAIDPLGLRREYLGYLGYAIDYYERGLTTGQWNHVPDYHYDPLYEAALNAMADYLRKCSPVRGISVGVRRDFGNNERVKFRINISGGWTIDSGLGGSFGVGVNIKAKDTNIAYSLHGVSYSEQNGVKYQKGLSVTKGAARIAGGVDQGGFTGGFLGFRKGPFNIGLIIDYNKLITNITNGCECEY